MDTIYRLIKLNIEIEGLLRTMVVRDNEDIRTLLVDKHNEFSQLFDSIIGFAEPASDEQSDDAADILTDQEADEADNEPITLDAEAVFVIEEETAIMPDGPEAQNDEVVDDENPEPELDVDTKDDFEPIQNSEQNHDFEAEQELESESEPELVSEDEEVSPSSALNEFETLTLNDAIPSASNDIRVDEALSRREALDLKRAFTLNDKFRFRRGLFGNNDSLFADTLNTLMAMHSIDEAEEYLYGDMGWSPEDEDVKDFVSIVRNHFAALA